MAEIALEIQPQTQENDNPKPETKNSLGRTMLKLSGAALGNIKLLIPTMADGEKVQPASEESPNNGPDESAPEKPDKPKKGHSRLKLILKILAAVVVVVGLLNFFLWVIINPRKMKFYVTDAQLTEFSLSDDNTLRYSLRLNLTARNPNKRIGFRYDSIVGGAYYGKEKFDSGNLATFYQPPKTTTGVDTWFSGIKRLSLGWDEVEGFNEHKSSGVYPIDVKIRVYSSIKLGKIRMGDFKVKIKCGLKVPLLIGTSNGGESIKLSNNVAGFKATQCHVDFNPLVVIYSD